MQGLSLRFAPDEHQQVESVCVCVFVEMDKGLLKVELICERFGPIDSGVVQV